MVKVDKRTFVIVIIIVAIALPIIVFVFRIKNNILTSFGHYVNKFTYAPRLSAQKKFCRAEFVVPHMRACEEFSCSGLAK